MSISPTNPYLNVFFEQTGNVTQARQYFPGSVETVNITTANHVFTVSTLAATEVRARDLVNITVTNQQNTTITINKNYHLVGDTVTFAWTPTDVTGGTTISIVDDAASPNTLATITATSEGTRSRSSRSFTLGTAGLWISTASVPTPGSTLPSSPAEGDILYYHSGAWASLTTGTANQVLTSNGTDPVYASALSVPGAVKSSTAAGGIGYATGAGGAVTQATSKSTTVALNKVTGQITMNAAALAAGVEVVFTVTNTSVVATDVVVPSIASGGTAGAYGVGISSTGAGTFDVVVTNQSSGSLSEALVINFVVLKGVAA